MMPMFSRVMVILGILALILAVVLLLRQPTPSGSGITTMPPPSLGRTVGKSALSHGGPGPTSSPAPKNPGERLPVP
ncbi:MAG: hypothetical protein ABW047_09745 [Nitrospiraceae bacterium]